MSRHVQLALQRGQQLLCLGQHRLLLQQHGLRHFADRVLVRDDALEIRVGLDRVLLRGDRGAQARLLKRRGHHIGAEADIGGIQLVALVIRLGAERFHRAAVQAEHVRGIRDGDLRGVERIKRLVIGADRGEAGGGGEVFARAGADSDAGEEAAILRQHIFLGLLQRGLGGGDRGVRLQGLFDQPVQRR